MSLPLYDSDESARPESTPPRPTKRPLFLAPLVIGFFGGLLGVVFSGIAGIFPANVSDDQIIPNDQMEMRSAMAEDSLLVDLVEKNSPGVVSVVITKDVPIIRQQPLNPFGGFPFFFGPEGLPSPLEEENETREQQVGSGSGFFVSSDGLIVTNRHVVSDMDASYTIITKGGTEYPATVLARDPNNDIAVLKIEAKNKDEVFPTLTLGDSDAIKVGQTAIAIGNPLGEFANSVSRGIISGLGRNVDASSGFGEEERLSNIIQTDAAINPGNSGGPLFGLNQAVIGVNVAVAQGAENIGFALPINSVKRVIEEVRTTGRISTPYLGVRHALVNASIQAENNLPEEYGALVIRGQSVTDLAVLPNSPADKAGIREGDVILEIDGTKIDEDHPLGSLIGNHKVGDEVTVKILSKGDTKDIRVRLEERPQE